MMSLLQTLHQVKIVRIVGLKQEGGVNFFQTFFANFSGMEKAYEESKPKE